MVLLDVEQDRGPGANRSVEPEKITNQKPADETEGRTQEPILCRRCGQLVSDHRALFTVDSDRIARVFANPHGFLHEVVTVRWAQGLTVVGPATTEFTWYPGYAWEIAHCDQCHSHLGWAFSAVGEDIEPHLFWGLRRGQLRGI